MDLFPPKNEYPTVESREECRRNIVLLRNVLIAWEAEYEAQNGGVPYPPIVELPNDVFNRWLYAYFPTIKACSEALGIRYETMRLWSKCRARIPMDLHIDQEAYASGRKPRLVDLPHKESPDVE